MRNLLWWLAALFVLWWIINEPASAALALKGAGHLANRGAEGLASLLGHV